MTYKQISRLDKRSIPAGREAEYAEYIRRYIVHKNKQIRAFIITFSCCFVACMLFLVIGRSAELIADHPAVFWPVFGVLAAASVAFAAVVGVNMFLFQKFLKRFD